LDSWTEQRSEAGSPPVIERGREEFAPDIDVEEQRVHWDGEEAP